MTINNWQVILVWDGRDSARIVDSPEFAPYAHEFLPDMTNAALSLLGALEGVSEQLPHKNKEIEDCERYAKGIITRLNDKARELRQSKEERGE